MLYRTFICFRQIFLLSLHKSLLCHTMELKDIMKQRRETLSLTQQDLAEMAQVGLATIKDIERGKENPSLNTVKKILEVLGIEIEQSSTYNSDHFCHFSPIYFLRERITSFVRESE